MALIWVNDEPVLKDNQLDTFSAVIYLKLLALKIHNNSGNVCVCVWFPVQ